MKYYWFEIFFVFLVFFEILLFYVSCNLNYEWCFGEEVCILFLKFCDKKKDCYLGGDESSCNGKCFFFFFFAVVDLLFVLNIN